MPIEMPRGLPFAVDTWGPSSSRRRRHRFLTHAHRDHLVGAAAPGEGPRAVYATRLTMALALRHFPQLEREEFVEMEVGKTVVVDDPAGGFSVTAYDANHCPGAVMFLFEGQFGSILHTGDCRFTSDCVQNLPLKYIAKKGKENVCRLDFVFLDCTFSKCFLKLPSKESAIQQVIACIWKHPDAPFVYLACDLLGHEDILVEVSRTFGSKIYVDKRRSLDCFRALSLVAPEIITDDPSCRFQVVGFQHLYDKACTEIEKARTSLQPEPLFIRPSTQWYAHCAQSQKPSLTEAVMDECGVWHVCFSIHSSRDELEQALQLLHPQWVISTTPPCFAMELSYVKKNCFKTRLTADDPLWKIFGYPLQKSASSSLRDSDKHTNEDQSIFVEDDHDHSTSHCGEECTNFDVSTLELKFVPSLPVQEPDITLFGRARFGLEEIDIMKEELCNQWVTVEEARAHSPSYLISDSSGDGEKCPDSGIDFAMEQVSKSQQDYSESEDEDPSCQPVASPRHLERRSIQYLPIGECSLSPVVEEPEKSDAVVESESINHAESSNICMVRSGETTDCQRDILCVVGSSKCLNASLKRLYRSKNVPVPRPLPSLVGLLKSAKRVKVQRSTD
ncbi:5' exonuclease Apollo-like isoform X2 [Oryza brachyantha]|uniref:DNA repair metallo-beta-lactamase domain-containing protein n=1 Tax=Oryza brachyantha TaxID=4533 RepID=J3L6G1_ORYBR|nr:5' exonuclease Apollo-like isoform X2 [Oryza brachyantha]